MLAEILSSRRFEVVIKCEGYLTKYQTFMKNPTIYRMLLHNYIDFWKSFENIQNFCRYRVMQSYMWVNAKLYVGLCKVICGLIQYYMWFFLNNKNVDWIN